MEFKLPSRIQNSNKGTYGKVLNVAGSDYMTGAAYLSSVSALKIGCGYCFLYSTKNCIKAVSSQTQNVVFVPYRELTKQIKSANVIEIGCGLSQNLYSKHIFNKVISNIDSLTPIVIDADGLNILAKNDKMYFKKNLKNVILTPHPKEAARLLGCSLEEILSDIQNSAKRISQKYNCVTVLKTHKTYIYSPDSRDYTNTTGNNSLAKAGSGDVLTGIISGLIAQKMPLFEASCLGVYLHGLCADIAVEKLTNYCVMANDIIDFIPDAICRLNS